jgi:hypothetical protein
MAQSIDFRYYRDVILLKPSIVNKVALTLSEAATIADPKYLFVLKSVQSKEVFTFIAADGSLYKDRYNLFEIEVKSNPDRLSGEIDINLGDEYTYTIHEQSSDTNLDPSLSGGVLETGILLYKVDFTPRDQYEYTTNERAVYKG